MTELPLPDDINKVVGWKEDATLQATLEVFLLLPITNLEEFWWSRNFRIRLKPKPVIGADDCFLVYRSDGVKFIQSKILKRMYHILAWHIGLKPAKLYEFILWEYDEDYKKKYWSSFTCCCKFRQRYCVRPSHLIPCTYHGRPLRP